jgi:hypothetical protein
MSKRKHSEAEMIGHLPSQIVQRAHTQLGLSQFQIHVDALDRIPTPSNL